MNVEISNSSAKQPTTLDKGHDFVVFSHDRLWEICQRSQDQISLLEITQGDFADHERVGENVPCFQQIDQQPVARAQVVYPDRSIDQDHAGRGRRRGGRLSAGSCPPRRAKRRALSRSIKAFSASRTRADFSSKPVNACAFASKSSSNAR